MSAHALALTGFVLLGASVTLVTSATATALTSARVERDPVAMVLVPAGWFLMGSSDPSDRQDERPQRKVYLDDFRIDLVEVTNQRYTAFLRATGREPARNPYGAGLLEDAAGVTELPVVQVTWHDAVDYCRWAGKRLPTEAEWEKAARGADGRRFPWGDAPPTPERATFGKAWDGARTMRPVGTTPDGASPFGVQDMAGNVREWVQNWYHPDYYSNAPDRNPRGPEDGILKVIRGGSWHNRPTELRVTARQKGGFALKTDGVGFRCAQAVGAPR